MGMDAFLQKEPKKLGAHQIGAAISSPRIVGEHFYGHLLLKNRKSSCSSSRQLLSYHEQLSGLYTCLPFFDLLGFPRCWKILSEILNRNPYQTSPFLLAEGKSNVKSDLLLQKKIRGQRMGE